VARAAVELGCRADVGRGSRGDCGACADGGGPTGWYAVGGAVDGSDGARGE
jgi:hypothetical protein